MQKLYLLNRLLYSPLEALYPILIFILCKELHATPLQLAVLAATKPVVSLFAFQLSALLADNSQRFRAYLMAMTLMSALPCLLFPCINNSWYFIASYALFMTALRASTPAWIEILKRCVGLHRMSSIVGAGSAINYALMMALPALAIWLDSDPGVWKGCFAAFGLLLLLNLLVLCFVALKPGPEIQRKPLLLWSAWKKAWRLLRARRDFAHYQALYFLGGAGLVALQPILPYYFNETLHLSYTQLTLAFSLCKGLAFVSSTPIWAKWAKHVSLYRLYGAVLLLSAVFVACILSAAGGQHWLWVAYLLYGAMQAGFEMSWNISPPAFSQENESTLFASTNLAFAGLRGCICPFAGQMLFLYTGSFAALALCGALCLLSFFYAEWLAAKSQFEVRI